MQYLSSIYNKCRFGKTAFLEAIISSPQKIVQRNVELLQTSIHIKVELTENWKMLVPGKNRYVVVLYLIQETCTAGEYIYSLSFALCLKHIQRPYENL